MGRRKQSVESRERARRAVDLKIAGATWPQISEELGMATEAGARLLVSRYFEGVVSEQFEQMHPILLERAELLWRRAWSKLNSLQGGGTMQEWDRAMTQCVNVLSQLARISGLGNGPVIQVNLTAADDVRALRDEFYQLRGITPPVIDAEVVDDDTTEASGSNGKGHNGFGDSINELNQPQNGSEPDL